MSDFKNILFDPVKYHIIKEKHIIPSMAFDPRKDYDLQKKNISGMLGRLLNIPKRVENPKPSIEYKDNSDPEYDEIRFYVESEPGFYFPAHMLIPKKRSGKIPLVICLQGHSTGMHVSLGREPYPGRASIKVEGDRDFCIQAVARGYAAVAMEQRGFGELNFSGKEFACHELSCQALLMGKTLLGERVADISALIDAVAEGFDFIDTKRIGCMGNSGGGTSSYFAGCLDERIKVVMPSSAFCTFVDAWGSIYHCSCGYIPGILKYAEMPDLAIMISPRPLIIVSGMHDPIQPIEAVEKGYRTVRKIYSASGAPENSVLIVGKEGHRFYASEAWRVFDRFI